MVGFRKEEEGTERKGKRWMGSREEVGSERGEKRKRKRKEEGEREKA